MEHCDRRIAEVETAARSERKQLTDTIAVLERERVEQTAIAHASVARVEEIKEELRRDHEVDHLSTNELIY